MGTADGGEAKAPHKVHKAGGKIKKKQAKDKKERHNPKAFTFSGGANSVHRKVQRTLDIQTKREHSKLTVDKTPETNAPPFIVAVQGPPGAGKSTLIRSLVKHYSKHNVTSINGPITLVSGKSRRLTFLECPNDVPAMVDVAKIADLVLLMIDGSFGFEMETFEFLNMLQVHGFPRIIGVLTHLDNFAEKKSLRKMKKKLKSRFWAEIYDGAKLFFLSGLQYGRYNKTEILNLSRFISIQKFVPLSFRSQRPYLLALRCEDNTPADHENQAGTETMTAHIYGYLKGATIRSGISVHIPGAGDFSIDSVDEYLDPCPLPHKSAENKNDGGRLLRTLKTQDRRIYAPDCNIGNVRYDEDSMYIHLADHKVGFTKVEDIKKDESDGTSTDADSSDEEEEEEVPEAVGLVRELQNADGQLSQSLSQQRMRLLPTSKDETNAPKDSTRRRVPAGLFTAVGRESDKHQDSDDDGDDTSDDDEDAADGPAGLEAGTDESGKGTDHETESSDDEIENEFDSEILGRRKQISHSEVQEKFKKEISLGDLIYNISNLHISNDSWLSDQATSGSHPKALFDDLSDDEEEETQRDPKGLLGNLDSQKERNLINLDESNVISDASMYRGLGLTEQTLEDVEQFWSVHVKRQLRGLHFITGGWDGDAPSDGETTADTKAEEKEGKGRKDRKETSTEERLAEIEAEMAKEKEEEQRSSEKAKALLREAQAITHEQEGSSVIGTYVRIVVKNLPVKWFEYIKKQKTPLIVGGLLAGETALGMLQARVKKHRWAPKILKSNDALMISVGWRRFQSLPVYCLEDRNNVRVKMLKYTPEHLHCLATFYGPVSAPSLGVLAIRNWASNTKMFRISCTGLILDTAPDFKIVKKLKLVGEPSKIYKNTAFIKKMFTSDLEVSKCLGAKIQTVSGLRGQIKKAQGTDGTFRATFEDKILMSDIVLCKSWIKIEPKEFCNPVLDVPGWRRLRTQAEIRNDLQLPAPSSGLTDYGKRQERQTRRFNPLKIPKNIEKNLPFKNRPKEMRAKKKTGGVVSEATAVILNDYEKTVATMFNRLHFMAKAKQKDRHEAFVRHRAAKEKEEEKVNAIRAVRQKEVRKKRNALQGAQEARDRKRLRIED